MTCCVRQNRALNSNHQQPVQDELSAINYDHEYGHAHPGSGIREPVRAQARSGRSLGKEKGARDGLGWRQSRTLIHVFFFLFFFFVAVAADISDDVAGATDTGRADGPVPAGGVGLRLHRAVRADREGAPLGTDCWLATVGFRVGQAATKTPPEHVFASTASRSVDSQTG